MCKMMMAMETRQTLLLLAMFYVNARGLNKTNCSNNKIKYLQ